jgi:FixJ family two-component response regulator
MMPVPPGRRAAVLVIDDDPDVLASLKFALEVEGFPVEVFRSADEFLAAPLASAPACLVVDYRLPGTDGVELVVRLREDGMEAPAFLITTDPPLRVRQRASEAGLVIIEKPLLGNVLAEAIRSVVTG